LLETGRWQDFRGSYLFSGFCQGSDTLYEEGVSRGDDKG
jgi:hypothetical protein